MTKHESQTAFPLPPTIDPFPSETCVDTLFGRFCFPISSTGPTFPIPPASVGAFHGSMMRKLIRRHREAGGSREKYMRAEVQRICDDGMFSVDEARTVNQVIDLMLAHDSGDTGAAAKLSAVHERLIDDDASPAAVMISGIAVDSANNPMAAVGVGTADVAGGLGGIAAGGAIGGLGGALALGGFFAIASSFAVHVEKNED